MKPLLPVGSNGIYAWYDLLIDSESEVASRRKFAIAVYEVFKTWHSITDDDVYMP